MEISEQQGWLWFFFSLALGFYFWAASTSSVWSDPVGRPIVIVIFVVLLVGSIANYKRAQKSILRRYEALFSK